VQAALAAAKSKLEQAENAARLIESQTQTAIEVAESGVKAAKERLTIAQNGTRKQELKQAELGVEQASAQLDQAKVDMQNARQVFERRQTLLKQDAIAREEVDEAERRYKAVQSRVEVAEAEVAAAREKLDLSREGTRPEEIRIAQGQYIAAERALRLAQSEARRKQVAENDVAAAKAAVQQAEAAVRSAKAGLVQNKMSLDEVANAEAMIRQARGDIEYYTARLADLTIRAPVSGVVSTRRVNSGEVVKSETRLMEIVSLDTVYLEALVPELEVGQIKVGTPTDVTVDALGGKQFRGSVREVIPIADPASKAFRVRIALVGGGGKLPAGGFARAAVHVGRRPQALVVAKQAIQTEAGSSFVWKVASGKEGAKVAQRQPVRTGLVDDRYAEVLSGLQQGQQVITAGSPAIIEGTPIAVASP
jgi:RND family efflux transporter MFP subunit